MSSNKIDKTIVSDLLVPFFDNLSATFIVSLVVALSYLFLKPREEQIILVKKTRIEEELEISRSSTTAWKFSGGTGTETRSVTIPYFANLGRSKSRSITIQIIDPRDLDLCQKYTRYRNRNYSHKEWTEREVQLKIYSTILSCLYWSQKSNIDIDIYLKNNFSTLRYDISDTRIIITKENPEADAFLIKSPHSFFDSIINEFTETLKNSQWINIDNCKGDFKDLFNSNVTITKEFISEQFSCIGINDNFTDHEVKLIVSYSKSASTK